MVPGRRFDLQPRRKIRTDLSDQIFRTHRAYRHTAQRHILGHLTNHFILIVQTMHADYL